MNDDTFQPLRTLLAEKLVDSLAMPFPAATPRRVHGTVSFPGKATAVIGMRRAGKTTFLHQLRRERHERGIERVRLPYINFEDERLVELERRGMSVSHVRTRQGYEVDFLAGSPTGEAALIQVCADLDDSATREREVRALLAAAVEHPHASLHLITLTPETAHGLPGQVTLHPAAQWLLAAGI